MKIKEQNGDCSIEIRLFGNDGHRIIIFTGPDGWHYVAIDQNFNFSSMLSGPSSTEESLEEAVDYFDCSVNE